MFDSGRFEGLPVCSDVVMEWVRAGGILLVHCASTLAFFDMPEVEPAERMLGSQRGPWDWEHRKAFLLNCGREHF
jgi:hypothetical protein